jgi:hypothetical protein
MVVITLFSVYMFDMYSFPTIENTSVASGTISDVYVRGGKNPTVIVETSDGEQLVLVCPYFLKDLYEDIGYNLDQLAELLEGKNVEYRIMDKLSWVLEIYVDDVVIDNSNLTRDEIVTTQVGIVILAILMIVILVCVEIIYLQPKYKLYQQYERKRLKRVMRELQKAQRREKKQNSQ